MVSLTLDPDIVKLGIWLKESGNFKDRNKLLALWLFYVILTIMTEFYAVYQVFLENGYMAKNYFSMTPEKTPAKFFVCEQKFFQILFPFILLINYVNNMYDNVALLQSISFLSRGFLLTHMFFSSALLFISMSFITVQESFSDVVINMAALLVLEEVDDYVGQFFLNHLRTHYQDIVTSPDFMKFEIKTEDMAYVLKQTQVILVNFILTIVFNAFLKKDICNNFDEYYHQKYESKTGYKPTFYFRIVEKMELMTKFILFVNVIAPAIPLSVYKFYIKKTAQKVEKVDKSIQKDEDSSQQHIQSEQDESQIAINMENQEQEDRKDPKQEEHDKILQLIDSVDSPLDKTSKQEISEDYIDDQIQAVRYPVNILSFDGVQSGQIPEQLKNQSALASQRYQKFKQRFNQDSKIFKASTNENEDEEIFAKQVD